MTPAILRDIGESLYGTRWQFELSRDLAVSDRTMRRWLAQANPIPDGVRDELRALLAERRGALDRAMARLR